MCVVLALGLGMGVATLSVVSLNSRAIVLVEDGEDVDVLHARLGIAAGLSTAISIMLMYVCSSGREQMDVYAPKSGCFAILAIGPSASSLSACGLVSPASDIFVHRKLTDWSTLQLSMLRHGP